MKSRFPRNMGMLYISRVFFESSRSCFHAVQRVKPLLQMWQWAHDEQFTLPVAISQLISRHTPTLPNSFYTCDDDSTGSTRLMKCVVLVFNDPHGFIWPMIVIMQKWFTIFNLLIQDRQYLAVEPLQEGYASSWLWFHAFENRLQ